MIQIIYTLFYNKVNITLRCREERYPCTPGEGFLHQESAVGSVSKHNTFDGIHANNRTKGDVGEAELTKPIWHQVTRRQ